MDNLIRASQNKPFVQLVYSQLSVLDQDKGTATAAGGEADFSRSTTVDLTKSTPALQFVRGRAFLGKFPLGATGERDRTLSFHADPVTDQNYIYEAYLAFARNPERFMVTDEEPPCPTCIKRRCGCKWYWVPVEASDAFLELVLKTSVAPEPAAAAVYWDSAIASVSPRFDENGRPVPNAYVVTLTKEVPNDNGTMIVVPKAGKPLVLTMQAQDVQPFVQGKRPQEPRRGPLPGSPTKVLYTQLDDAKVPPQSLAGASARFISENFPNTKPQQAADLQKIQDTLENIRLLINKQSSGTP
jgi:hypothetical protein